METELFDARVPICLQCAARREAKTTDPQGRQDVHRTLAAGVSEATARVNAANEALAAIIDSVPSGIPYPDGSQRIQNASHDLSAARQALTEAQRRLNDFVNRGIVPDETKRNTAKTGERSAWPRSQGLPHWLSMSGA
jgi:hypothetical protein